MNPESGASTPSPARKILVIAIVFVIMGMTTGLVFYSIAVFIDDLSTHGGFSLPLVSLAATLSSFAGGIGGIWVARMLRRRSTRSLLVGGAISSGLALAWVGNAHAPWELCLAFIAMGLALALMGNVPCTELLARCFHPSPGKAITISTSGMSVGGALMPPVVLSIVTTYGMPLGSVLIGAGLCIVVVLAAIVVWEPPRRPPQATTGDTTARAEGFVTKPIWRRLERFRMPVLPSGTVALMVAFGLLIFSQVATTAHLLGIARERGVSDAALVLSVIAVVSIGARFVGMAVLTRVRLKWFALAVALLQAASQIVYSGADSLGLLLLGSVLLGLTVGNVFVLMSLYVLAGFELASYASIYALVGLGTTIGAGFGPLFLGGTATLLGGYAIPLLAAAVACVIGAIVLLSTGIDSEPKPGARAVPA